MLSLDPIRQYLWALKALAAAAIASTLFVQGCNHGKREQAADDQAVLDEKNHDLLVASTALRDAGTALRRVSAATRAAEIAAEAQALLSAAEVTKAQARARVLDQELDQVERELERAKTDPDCRKLLETPSCAAFR